MDPEPAGRRVILIFLISVLCLLSTLLKSFILAESDLQTYIFMPSIQKIESTSRKKWKAAPPEAPKGHREISTTRADVLSDDQESQDAEINRRLSRIHQELQSCLMRFICEIHAKPPGGNPNTKLENDILSLFKNSIYLEGPNSPIYPYQMAAHMGYLAVGLTPSPCQNMYTNCPLSSYELMGILSGSKAPSSLLL